MGAVPFTLVNMITGLGATCNVRLCTYKLDGNDYAVKIIRLNEEQIQSEPRFDLSLFLSAFSGTFPGILTFDICREVTILSHLRNEFIVKFTQVISVSPISSSQVA